MTEDPTQEIFTIKVQGTTDLDVTSPMNSVICRISIVNIQTSELLTKYDSNRHCVSAFETTEYISPVSTKPVSIKDLSDLSPSWNESFIFNEPLVSLLSSDVLIFFEIIDTYIHQNRHGVTPIAWAFLRLKNEEMEHYNHPVVLQLHSYPTPHFDVNIKGAKLPVASLLSGRTKTASRLTVEVRTAEMTNDEEVTNRAFHFFQKEISRESYTKLIDRHEDESEGGEQGSEAENLPKKKKRKKLRPANRNCTIPRHLAAQIPAGERGALALKFSMNGDILAAAIQNGVDYCIQLYNTSSCDKYAVIRAHVDIIYELTFSPDDRYLMSVSADGMAKVWKTEGENQRAKSTLAHPNYVYSGQFHPQNDKLVVTAGFDGIVRLWDRPKGKILRSLTGHKTRVNSITFSPDGKNLYCGDADGIISVWATDLTQDGIDGLQNIRFIKEGEFSNISITHLEMGKSNFSLLVHTQDNIVRIFETKVMVPSQRYTGITCKKFQMMSTFSPDGKYILAGSEDGTVMLWTVRKGEPLPVEEWNAKFDHPVTAVAWNRVENMIAFSSFGDAQPILIYTDPDTPIDENQDDF